MINDVKIRAVQLAKETGSVKRLLDICSATYFLQWSIAPCAMPKACAATPIRPPSNVARAILKPFPNSPNCRQ